jgi:BirA family transcriptional regulator, biotin operon repressor / biotin---[acetyl-CoA-carboxylase] ligase
MCVPRAASSSGQAGGSGARQGCNGSETGTVAAETLETGGGGTYDGDSGTELASALRLPQVLVFDSVASTLDVAHAAATVGAPAGTLVLADTQTAGRGRMGRHWQSERGVGIWLTLIERPASLEGIPVLSVRIGLRVAPVLDGFAERAVRLKWPNDLIVGDRKLAGILIEARWRAERLDWIAIGFGLNVRPPADLPAAGLISSATRLKVLHALVPPLRAAAAATGPLTPEERAAFAARDVAHGRRCLEPVPGVVAGIDAFGALLVDSPSGRQAIRRGSLVLEPITQSSQQETAQ